MTQGYRYTLLFSETDRKETAARLWGMYIDVSEAGAEPLTERPNQLPTRYSA